MRVIKYRFYDTLMGQWATDWLAINSGRLVADAVGKEFVEVSDTDRFIPCQFTGLLDKNEVEIYEGDIAIWHVNDIQRTGEIYYTGQAFDLRNDVTDYGCIGWDALRGVIEIIGNRYENLELLST